VRSGATSIEVPEQRVAFEAAIAPYLTSPEQPAGHAASGVPARVDAAPDITTASTAPASDELPRPWQDLAVNRPGEMARAQAEVELAAMRERTRVGTFIARALDMKTDERAWRVGAGGEETVGERLEKLKKHGWHVLHSVPIGNRGSDIDHVLIGRGGVYTINTKNHPGKKVWVSPRQVLVNGHPEPYLRNSRFEAERATKLLTAAVGFPVFAKPVLVFLTGTLIPDVTIKQQPADVLVLDRMDVPSVFKRSPTRLDTGVVERIFEMARRSTTWER
jgi:hypothetical protein